MGFFIPQYIQRNTTPISLCSSLPVNALSYSKIQIASMMEENEKMDPIAKLEEQEFCLDLEELERLQDESEEEAAKVGKDLTRLHVSHGTRRP